MSGRTLVWNTVQAKWDTVFAAYPVSGAFTAADWIALVAIVLFLVFWVSLIIAIRCSTVTELDSISHSERPFISVRHDSTMDEKTNRWGR